MTSSSLIKDNCLHGKPSQLIWDTPKISLDCSIINFQICRTSVLKWDLSCICWWNVCFLWVILSHEYRCFQCRERLSMSCIASFEEWSNIFRTRSFTLCKNDRDFNERSDPVAVSESISSSSMTNLSVCWVNGGSPTGLSVLAPNISPDFHSWADHLSSMFHSE